jgi:tripartite-type tricarboxylate transporter receptor subunit TctC
MKRFSPSVVATLLAVGLTLPSAHAQTWPSKPIRTLLAAAPGVPSDTLGRALMEPLTKSLGVPVVMENRAGADGIIGTELCAKAPADGYTLCVTQSGQMIWNPALRSDLPYDTLRDFVPVVHTVFFDSVLMVHPSVKAGSVDELFKLAQARPNQINWGHFGVNSTGYMYQEYFKQTRRAPFYAVPYKTQPQTLQALLAGEVQASVSSLTNAAPHIKAGKVRALAVTADQRVAFLPEVPTFAEEGIKLPLRTWFGYHYQAGVPRAYVLRMNAEIRNAMRERAFKEEVLDRMGLVPVTGTPEEFDAFIRSQLKAVKELVASLGIKLEK